MVKLENAYVVTSGGVRLEQFRRCLGAVGIDGGSVKEWKWCHLDGEGRMGNAVAQYSLVRHALEARLPYLVVFEDDAVPCDDAGSKLEKALSERKEDVLCLSLGWSADSDPEMGDDRGAKRRVYGSHAYALFGEKAYLAYMQAWEKNGCADIVLGLIEGSKLAKDNMFAQHTPGGVRSLHLAAGWTMNADDHNVANGDIKDRYRKVRAEIERMNREREMHIVYCVDVQGPGAQSFEDMLLASVSSLILSQKGDPTHVHVLYGNMSAELMRRLLSLNGAVDGFRVTTTPIRRHDLDYMQTLTTNNPKSSVRTWSGIVFARLWIPLALPGIDRAIYLDADTLVRKPLRPLWDTKFGESEVLAMNMGTVPEYGFNSGVILFDCKAMRGDADMWRRLSTFLSENARSFYCPDQTAINRFFAGRIKAIGREWNYPPKPGCQDADGMNNAAVWHFYEGGKPIRNDSDDFRRACLSWNSILRKAEEAAK